MKTQIFNSYQDFLNREDKTINGVSIKFSVEYPNYAEQNETNDGCWNCRSCSDCSYFSYCSYCIDCKLGAGDDIAAAVKGASLQWTTEAETDENTVTDDDNTQTGAGGGNNNPPSGELEG